MCGWKLTAIIISAEEEFYKQVKWNLRGADARAKIR